MGSRKLGYIEFRQSFLFPTDEVYREFAESLLTHLHSVASWEEAAFATRGIEIIENDQMTEIEDDD
jgi:hypothetical protein